MPRGSCELTYSFVCQRTNADCCPFIVRNVCHLLILYVLMYVHCTLVHTYISRLNVNRSKHKRLIFPFRCFFHCSLKCFCVQHCDYRIPFSRTHIHTQAHISVEDIYLQTLLLNHTYAYMDRTQNAHVRITFFFSQC